MSTHVQSLIIDIPAYSCHKETIILDSGFCDRVVQVRAGAGASVFVVCIGVDMSGSLLLDIKAEYPETVIKVGIACTLRGADVFDIRSMQHHESLHTTSHLVIRKIIYDTAQAQYHGMIHITNGAEGSNVSQNDKTLLDGPHTRAESVPGIEVLNNNVVCAHGSAIGRIDADLLWYIQSRGISYDQAKQLWYAAFLDEVRVAVFQEEHL